MQAIRNALGSMGIGGHNNSAGPSARYNYNVECTIRELYLERMPEKHLARNKFEPYLALKRNDEAKAAHRTFTKKDYNLNSRDVIPYNEKYEIDFNQEDSLHVMLYNDSPILRPDQAVAEGVIPIRDLLGASSLGSSGMGITPGMGATGVGSTPGMSSGMGTTPGMSTGTVPSTMGTSSAVGSSGAAGGTSGNLINTREFELPLYEVMQQQASGGLMGGLKHHGASSTSGSTAATSGSAVPASGTLIGRVKLFLRVFERGSFSKAATSGTTAGTSTTASDKHHGGMMGTAGLPRTQQGTDPEGLGQYGTKGGMINPTGTYQQPGQHTFDVMIKNVNLDYAILERLYNYKREAVDSKITPYVMVRTNGEASTSVKTDVCRYDHAGGNYKFDANLRTWAKPTDTLFFYLVDDNLITRDTYLGYAELPLSSMGGMGSVRELRFKAMDPKNNKTASLPSTGASDLGFIGTLFFSLSEGSIGATTTGKAGQQSLTTQAGQAAHLGPSIGAAGSQMQGAGGSQVGGMGQTGHQSRLTVPDSTLGQTSSVGQQSNLSQTSGYEKSSISSVPQSSGSVQSSTLPQSGFQSSGVVQSSTLPTSGFQSSGVVQSSTLPSSGFQSSGSTFPQSSGSSFPQSSGSSFPQSSGVMQSGYVDKTSTYQSNIQQPGMLGASNVTAPKSVMVGEVQSSSGGTVTGQTFTTGDSVVGQGQNPEIHRV